MRLEEAKKDQYRKKAKEEGYRSRAAYKLIQLNDKYRMIRNGSSVVDVGSAPGGWLEVASEIVGSRGIVVGVDIVPVRPIKEKNVKIIQSDILSPDFSTKLSNAIGRGKADCVLADLSPKLSGIWDMDHFKQIELCHRIVDLLPEMLAKTGSCVLKAFHGEELDSLVKRLRKSFSRVDVSKPSASRSESSEVYLVSTDFNGSVEPRSSEAPEVERLSEPHLDSNESDLQSDRLT